MATASPNMRWQCNLSLSEGLSELRKRDLMTDVTFVVGADPSVKVTAHKLVLSARSPVFCTMFDGPLAESGDIEIPDIDGDTFNVMLRLMYEETVSINMTNVEKILYAAEKYDVEKLKIKCDEFLTENIDQSTNVLQTLELSQQYNLPSLTEKALEYIVLEPNKYLESDEFTKLSKYTFKSIVNCDDLPLEEIDVYNAALRWAETRCKQNNLSFSDENIRQVLEDILYLIRFPIMDIDTFCEEIAERNVLIPLEKVDIFKHFSRKTPKSSIFKSTPRKKALTMRVLRTSGEWYGSSVWSHAPRLESISFSLHKPCNISGILTLTKNCQANYTVSLTKNAEIMSSVDGTSKYTHTDDPNIVELHFPHRLRLKAGVVYNIELKFTEGTIYGYSKNYNQEVEFEKNKVTFSHCTSSMSTNVKRGLIPGLLFSS